MASSSGLNCSLRYNIPVLITVFISRRIAFSAVRLSPQWRSRPSRYRLLSNRAVVSSIKADTTRRDVILPSSFFCSRKPILCASKFSATVQQFIHKRFHSQTKMVGHYHTEDERMVCDHIPFFHGEKVSGSCGLKILCECVEKIRQ